ncbi:lysylphosphatidylglycerol synthetase-like protein (DUF2156 family) [Microbacterium sp. SORGH_AS428]|uniref:hypothetical protein n=1 Tax=Microbacterium sp. SORGH_AS_0428 TaxID=3041788 RepID=UPI00286398D2|nr:hypothetical protein [Microbacterium sp. SORGH_AS_0428]MDR6199288.1 lysylphosphatidylglycerol synthetase-like protein (DUF2156 family) [Microbacterium sp. SORGH_AS_0428]
MSTVTTRATTKHPAFAETDARAWARWGGGLVAAGGALLLAATVVEVGLRTEPTGPALPLFAVLFLASAAILAAAMLPLALGTMAANGITGSRVRGTFALLGFGAVFLANQLVYYVMTYGTPGGADAALGWLPLTLGIVQLVLLIVGAVGAVRAEIATGAARWALLALAAVVAVTGGIASASDDVATVTIALVSSCVAQIVVGAVFLAARPAASGGTV